MGDKITEIFVGTAVEAEFVVGLLADNAIPYLLRDLGKESRVAGWVADVVSRESCKVFVFEKDRERAAALLRELEAAPFDEGETE